MDVYEQKLSELQDVDGATDRAFMTSINNWNDMFGIASNKASVFAQQVGMKLLPYAKDFLSDAMPK